MGLNDMHTRGWRKQEEYEKKDKQNPTKIDFVQNSWRTRPHNGANRTHDYQDRNTLVQMKNRKTIQLNGQKPKEGSVQKVMQMMDSIRNKRK